MEEFEEILKLKEACRQSELEEFYERLKESFRKLSRAMDNNVMLGVSVNLRKPIFEGFANYVGEEIVETDCDRFYIYYDVCIMEVPF
jgi:hypothetical protein